MGMHYDSPESLNVRSSLPRPWQLADPGIKNVHFTHLPLLQPFICCLDRFDYGIEIGLWNRTLCQEQWVDNHLLSFLFLFSPPLTSVPCGF